MKCARGAVQLVVILVIAALGGLGLWVAKPKALHGDSQRAAASTDATNKLEDTTNKQGAKAAASVVKIGEANATAPASKEKDFISREVMLALGYLPAPDALALIDAEKRKTAIMEGRLNAASELYERALKDADQIRRERDTALAARRKADLELEQTAAERLGAERQRNQMLAVAGLCLALFVYVKLTHLSPGALAEAVRDIKAKPEAAITALDSVTSRFQQRIVNFLSRLNAPKQ